VPASKHLLFGKIYDLPAPCLERNRPRSFIAGAGKIRRTPWMSRQISLLL